VVRIFDLAPKENALVSKEDELVPKAEDITNPLNFA
jgi:hypothetical protein